MYKFPVMHSSITFSLQYFIITSTFSRVELTFSITDCNLVSSVRVSSSRTCNCELCSSFCLSPDSSSTCCDMSNDISDGWSTGWMFCNCLYCSRRLEYICFSLTILSFSDFSNPLLSLNWSINWSCCD